MYKFGRHPARWKQPCLIVQPNVYVTHFFCTNGAAVGFTIQCDSPFLWRCTQQALSFQRLYQFHCEFDHRWNFIHASLTYEVTIHSSEKNRCHCNIMRHGFVNVHSQNLHMTTFCSCTGHARDSTGPTNMRQEMRSTCRSISEIKTRPLPIPENIICHMRETNRYWHIFNPVVGEPERLYICGNFVCHKQKTTCDHAFSVWQPPCSFRASVAKERNGLDCIYVHWTATFDLVLIGFYLHLTKYISEYRRQQYGRRYTDCRYKCFASKWGWCELEFSFFVMQTFR